MDPDRGYHFHTGREAANRIGYDANLYATLPEDSIASFAGTGNPFSLGPVNPGDVVIDVGSGAGFDSLIASTLVGRRGKVIGIDMTPEMLKRARSGAETMRADNVDFRKGFADKIPRQAGLPTLLSATACSICHPTSRRHYASGLGCSSRRGVFSSGIFSSPRPYPKRR